MTLRDEPLTLRQTMRMGGRLMWDDTAFEAPVGHKRIERDINTDMREPDNIISVNHHVQVGNNIAFHVVFPGDNTPAITVANMRHDLGNRGLRHRNNLIRQTGQRATGRHRRLMGERALRTEIIQVALARLRHRRSSRIIV